MLNRFLSSFRAQAPRPLPEPDGKLALGALLVRVALSDRRYELVEIQRIDRILARLFKLGPLEAAKMRATCERLHASFPDTAGFARLIREQFDETERADAMAALWQVVLADGAQQEAELSVLREVEAALDLRAEQAECARRQALEG